MISDDSGIDGTETSYAASRDNGSTTSDRRAFWRKLTLSEVSGSCGDFGTLIPLLVAMSRQRSIYLAPTLFSTGLVHVITGLYWDIPMPLQPMKSIAAVAIAEGLSRSQVTTAGIWMGIFMTLLSLGGIEAINRLVPTCVVGGLQMGVGLRLAIKGIHFISDLTWWGSLDCILLAVVCSIASLYWLRDDSTPSNVTSNSQNERVRRCLSQKQPVGLYLFGVGVVLAAYHLATNNHEQKRWLFGEAIIVNALKKVKREDWKVGLLQGALPQLPLTTLNSVISTCVLVKTLFPNKPDEVTRRGVSLSVGLMNLLLCPIGCMPNCHGAGGLAGQHRLGAETGASMVFLGLLKMLAAIFFGGSLLIIMDALPVSILGLLLVISGHELATTGMKVLVTSSPDEMVRQSAAIAMVTCMVIVALGKTHYGALAGWIAYVIYGRGSEEFVRWWVGEGNLTPDGSAMEQQPLATSANEAMGAEETLDVSQELRYAL